MKKAVVFFVFLAMVGLAFFLVDRGFNGNKDVVVRENATPTKTVTATATKTTQYPVSAVLGPDKDGIREKYLRDIAENKGTTRADVRENFSHNNNR
jgi:hypothetical protein